MPEIRTTHLHLRSFRDDDLDAVAALCANEGFMRFSATGPIDREAAAALLERIMVRTRASLPAAFAVVDPPTARLIGYCGFLLQIVDNREEIEIGYRLHPGCWGRGLATEGVQAVRDYAFRDLQLGRVISLIVPENSASRRVAEKNGMLVEKETTFRGFHTLVYAISRGEWLTLQPQRVG